MDTVRLQSLPFIAISALIAAFVSFAIRFVRHRRWYNDLPKPPHSFFWGHLKLMGEMFALFPGSVHFQCVITTISQKYKLPGVFYIDMWPIGPTQLIITDPDLALYATVTRNHPKHEAEKMFVDPVVGRGNIVAAEGPEWKYLHNMLAPAFGVSYVRNMVGMIAKEVMVFRTILNQLAQSGEVFQLEELSNYLTVDVMGNAIFGSSFNAQTQGSPAVEEFGIITRQFAIERDSWNPLARFLASRRRLQAAERLDTVLRAMVRERFEILQRDNVDVSQKRTLSIIDLVLRDRITETRKSDMDTHQALDADFMERSVTQVKTMLLAGTGTTTDTICFIFMLLSAHPEVVQKLIEEHDRVFCPGMDATYSMLLENFNKVTELEYTANVIKETLRFFPIGNTARAGDATGYITYNGRRYSTKGQMLCPVQHTMHMNPDIFQNPKRFDPDRFTRQDFLRHAWRPFERGPRACLGQTLAMDELKIILLLTIREFDFQCANVKPNKTPRVPWCDLDQTFGDIAFQEYVFEAKPRNGMPMTVKRRAQY